MNLFFGKISQLYDTDQIVKGFYEAQKDKSWFGEIMVGDYCYLIGGNKIQFWKAKEWQVVNGKDRLVFEIINSDLGINTSQLVALKFLKLSKALIVLTSRSSKVAFHRLTFLGSLTMEDLADSSLYKDSKLYRRIILTAEDSIVPDSQDIQIFKKIEKLNLVKGDFYDSDVYEHFRDNSLQLGKGSKNKDSVIKRILDNIITGAVFDYNSMGIRSFYDAFFCDYLAEETEDIDKISEDSVSTLQLSNLQNAVIGLLRYKKQIILQGPPGTGKTKLAKEISEILLNEESSARNIVSDINNSHIFKYLTKGLTIKSFFGSASYFIKDILADQVVSLKTNNTEDFTIISRIIEAYNKRKWETLIADNPTRRAVAFAKYIYDRINNESNNNSPESIERYKLIQFHPSYTYEDFVRGIVSKPNEDGGGINYEAENKLLAAFAKLAWDNYNESQKDESNFEDKGVFEAFIDQIKDDLAQSSDHKYSITDAVYIFSADETRFKYKGDNWVAHQKGLNMKYSELKKIINAGAKERQDIKKMSEIAELSRQHATYFIKVIEKYHKFKELQIKTYSSTSPVKRKNYLLVIDEINRANLSSVLGELIYALEYRGSTVESMYNVDGSNTLVLPPNLYIIGTMNTADRSVGHIDYAIRRRFAFVDVIPRNLSQEIEGRFDSELFEEVQSLFYENGDYNIRAASLSPEFEPKDMALGHSYFIDKSDDGGNMTIRLEYEIKPILFEYVKDGILVGEFIKNRIHNLRASI